MEIHRTLWTKNNSFRLITYITYRDIIAIARIAHSRSKITRKNWSLVSFSCSKSLNNTLSFVQCTISFLIWQTQCIVTFQAYFFHSFSFLFHNEKFELKLSAHVILLNLWLIKVFPCLTPLRFFFASYTVKFIYSEKDKNV